MKKRQLIYIGLLAFFLTVGCTNKENNKTEMSSESHPQETTLTDALGNNVEVPGKPKRIIGSYLEDYLVALGITPVAQWSVNDGASVQTYLQDQLTDVPMIAHDLPFEAVIGYEPDLLLMGEASTVVRGKYDQYAKIGPTYVVKSGTDTSWRDKLIEIGTVVGEKEKAEKVLTDYDQKMSEAKAAIKESTKGDSAVVVWVVNNSIFMVRENSSSGAVLYNELGLEVPNLVQEISEKATADWSAVSLEKLAELDADHIFLVDSDQAIGSPLLEENIWKNIPAVKKGNLYEYSPETSWLYAGPIANSEIINDVVDQLVK